MNRKLKILICIKPFWKYVKHVAKFDTIKTLERFADVQYWYEDGHIHHIIEMLQFQPDFIFHYDIAWNNVFAPKIDGLARINIPKACFVIDLHWFPQTRREYFEYNQIDVIFSVSRHPFLYIFPEYEHQLSWMPWSINPNIYKDWGLQKNIDYLLMGLLYAEFEKNDRYQRPKLMALKGRYTFRDAVFKTLKNDPNFVYHPHPGHRSQQRGKAIVQEEYAKQLNQAKMFFTCGSRSRSGGYAVMKFFEAPACKTLLIAEPNKDVEALGFISGENYVACTVNQIETFAQYYSHHDEERRRITENGYRFIHKHHTNEVRAKQMLAKMKNFI